MLVFPLKKQWYEKIKSGEKTIEYREVKDYWTTRLLKFGIGVNVHDDTPNIFKPKPCKLRLGYTDKYLSAKITKVCLIINGKDTDLAIDKPVYAIHLTDVREITYAKERT